MKNLTKKIATRLKILRKNNGWSLSVASEKTGVSKAMLGQIERGESSPTIATLWKIINGFKVSFSSFIKDIPEDIMVNVYRKSDFKQIHPHDDKILIMPLFPFDEKLNFETFVIELLPSGEHISQAHAQGVIEHVLVIEGEMQVLANDLWHSLKKNEGLTFNANQIHGYKNTSSTKAVFHNMIHYTYKD